MTNPWDHKPPTTQQARDRLVTSRLELLWECAIHWPAKYRHAIETCLDTEREFDREALRRSVESEPSTDNAN